MWIRKRLIKRLTDTSKLGPYPSICLVVLLFVAHSFVIASPVFYMMSSRFAIIIRAVNQTLQHH